MARGGGGGIGCVRAVLGYWSPSRGSIVSGFSAMRGWSQCHCVLRLPEGGCALSLEAGGCVVDRPSLLSRTTGPGTEIANRTQAARDMSSGPKMPDMDLRHSLRRAGVRPIGLPCSASPQAQGQKRRNSTNHNEHGFGPERTMLLWLSWLSLPMVMLMMMMMVVLPLA